MSSRFRRREHRKIEPLRLRGWPGVTPTMIGTEGRQLMSALGQKLTLQSRFTRSAFVRFDDVIRIQQPILC